MTTRPTLRIATRKSALALWQAKEVSRLLREAHPDLNVELVTMTTKGDRILDSPLARIGGKGLFVKELEQGLLSGKADIAVHSMKDVPLVFPDGLGLHTILRREDPCDAFVSNNHASLSALPRGARVGTSSLRRQCQVKAAYPHLEILDLRGNVNTRLTKLDQGEYDAIVLAAAGLKRLGMAHRITEPLAPESSLPAIGQGAIGIECRLGDSRTETLIEPLDHAPTATRIRAERAINERLGGGCQVPIAGYATLDEGDIYLRGLVGVPDGSQILRAEVRAPAASPKQAGIDVANALLSQGAGPILEELGMSDTLDD